MKFENVQCEQCNKYYPERFMYPMFINGNYTMVDPECALKLKNQIHGTNHTSFIGTIAQQTLEDFRKYKKKGGDINDRT